ncbi:hypothetical protein CCH79_00002994 [Gambusia affinis]|uniref:Uncharacterized protein n=1 Tax=Gambusia affinis TaxID=33528 RepID=A0A315W755_GAMAF|nr:hypothetical protein CCH79_00002994 [Gambusia affinis]
MVPASMQPSPSEPGTSTITHLPPHLLSRPSEEGAWPPVLAITPPDIKQLNSNNGFSTHSESTRDSSVFMDGRLMMNFFSLFFTPFLSALSEALCFSFELPNIVCELDFFASCWVRRIHVQSSSSSVVSTVHIEVQFFLCFLPLSEILATFRFLRKVRVLQDHGFGLAQTVSGALRAFYPHLNRSLCSSTLLRSLNKWHLFNSILKHTWGGYSVSMSNHCYVIWLINSDPKFHSVSKTAEDNDILERTMTIGSWSFTQNLIQINWPIFRDTILSDDNLRISVLILDEFQQSSESKWCHPQPDRTGFQPGPITNNHHTPVTSPFNLERGKSDKKGLALVVEVSKGCRPEDQARGGVGVVEG